MKKNNEQLIKHPASTFFLRVKGYSMKNIGILNGDLLIVDRSLEAQPGHIVIAILDGLFTLKKLTYKQNTPYLEAEEPGCPPINLNNCEAIQIWGVATYAIHRLNRTKQRLHY